ncbi:hypothetical protein ONS95_008432 [Cadophora gregata]|uniref:uncharacterized protein n=1 Tax=Cadophora gregata TaxID=51156 RepID=UPI0026DCC8C4|nr:uncharacterized protein ONS95_008432 [Cadophora gregata]KAK0100483.1 hypothetical protein ONS96_007759 [Cadophora gregata f. sp. sojae]KAK0126853.1 hypothetical protein ONS95_008432 [Cadophora gregata]
MPLMPPGSKTGVYYIPVCNLPWNTTWKKLKDHSRNRQPDGSGLAILQANVYPGSTSTSGWVSVQGLADFRAAVDHLNHSAMEDHPRAARTLQADGRNETCPVMLKDTTSPSPSPSRQCFPEQNTWQPVLQHANSTHPQEFYPNWAVQPSSPAVSSPMSPSFSESSYYQPPSPHYYQTQTFNNFSPQNEYMQAMQPGMVLVPMSRMQQPLYMVPVEPQMQHLPQAPSPHHPQMFPLPQPPSPAPKPELHQPPKVIKTEARKIIITKLPLSCSEKDLQELITSVSSTRSRSPRTAGHRTSPEGTRYHLQHLEIARHSNGSPKGHAFAVLESYYTAKCTIDALNGLSWQGRTLQARFAKEGVESKSRGSRHTQSSESGESRVRSAPRINTRGRAHEQQVPRSMAPEPEPQYRYTGNGEAKVMEVDEYLCAQYSSIHIDYRGESSSNSSHSTSFTSDNNASEVSGLSLEGERERCRRILADEDTASHTPVVVDGSSFGKKRKSI